MAKKKNQKERIVDYIKDFGSITHLEAVRDLGCQRLASRISELKKMGYPIVSEFETGKNRYGEPTHYKRYSLEVTNG